MTGFVTARLACRPITVDDVDLLVGLDSDPEVMRFLTGGRASTVLEVTTVVAAAIGHRWIASLRSTGSFVGWVSLWPHAPGELELGYRLVRAAWGQGLATEAARAVIDVGFSERGATRVFAQTMHVNTPSRRVMERCGMRFVRTFHLEWDDPIPGTEHGEVEYELTRPEWEAARLEHGGDPACWLDQVCERCGGVFEGGRPHVCDERRPG